MSESCKVVFVASRQSILLLSRLIEAGLLSEKNSFDDEVLQALPEESKAEFKSIHEEILKKSGLTDFYERLKQL